ncbi:MAG: thioredoxin family protein [Flavobacteriaceae bacterium]|nr:thioredoxin family protein [Flavobacteriaceae bacterium]
MYFVLEEDNLQEIIDGNKSVFVQYGATWCGNCKIMLPKFKKFASENAHAQFVYVDAEKLPESRKLADVSNLPTFAYFEDGKLQGQEQTNKTEVLKTFIHEASIN